MQAFRLLFYENFYEKLANGKIMFSTWVFHYKEFI